MHMQDFNAYSRPVLFACPIFITNIWIFCHIFVRLREVNTSELILKLEKDNEVNVHIKIFMPLGQLESFN